MKIQSSAVLLIVSCTALLAVSQPGQTQSLPDSRVRRAERPIPNQYIVILTDGVDPEEMASDTELRHGGRRRHVFRSAARGFAVRLSALQRRDSRAMRE